MRRRARPRASSERRATSRPPSSKQSEAQPRRFALPHSSSWPRTAAMARGLFELRRDEITGWWVAVVVDREFNRARFQKSARPLGQAVDDCANCRQAEASPSGGVTVRMLKPLAFTVAGTEREARQAGQLQRDPELGVLGDRGSYQTILAPAGHHESLADTSASIAFELLSQARSALAEAREAAATDYL